MGDSVSRMLCHTGRRPQQEEPIAVLCGKLRRLHHEVHARHARGDRRALEACGPLQWLAVADDEISLLDDACEVGLLACGRDKVEISGHDLMGLAAREKRLQPLWQ